MLSPLCTRHLGQYWPRRSPAVRISGQLMAPGSLTLGLWAGGRRAYPLARPSGEGCLMTVVPADSHIHLVGPDAMSPANPIISQMPPPTQTRGSLFICKTFQNLKYNTQRKVPHPCQQAACCLDSDCLCLCQPLRVPQSLPPAFREDTFLVLVFVPSALPVCALCLCG